MNTDEHRNALLKGLIELAACLAATPGLPAPYSVNVHHFIEGDDDELRAEIDDIAALLGTEPDPRDREEAHYRVTRAFGPVAYVAVGIPAAARARHEAEQSYKGCVAPEPPNTSAPAA
ncbi:hypothetical protein ACFFMN_09710 [Planobispora siamensis]|uniref:Uncharacterized protein n=1 Tax=Planobispora siamensis TaxID=936338 RepID=A0A8J3WI25_9ACTN|nr:hypothetical protein [Planobispora siamensis]GIH91264.1 hypothetical protein Psi01_18940 [Planobispora siamensis]